MPPVALLAAAVAVAGALVLTACGAGGFDPVAKAADRYGSVVYLRSSLLSRLLSQGKTWVSVDVQKLGAKLGANLGQLAQTNPADVLPALKKAGSVQKLGTATSDGVQTTHYQAVIDPAKLPGGSALANVHVDPFPIDAWIGTDDGLLRRLTMSETASSATQSAATRWTMDLSNYGEQVAVTVPPAAETFDLTGMAEKMP